MKSSMKAKEVREEGGEVDQVDSGRDLDPMGIGMDLAAFNSLKTDPMVMNSVDLGSRRATDLAATETGLVATDLVQEEDQK